MPLGERSEVGWAGGRGGLDPIWCLARARGRLGDYSPTQTDLAGIRSELAGSLDTCRGRARLGGGPGLWSVPWHDGYPECCLLPGPAGAGRGQG